jgi:hypothetical protein
MTAPDAAQGPLAAAVAAGLDGGADPAVLARAEELAARPGVVAVLFYGNRLRAPEAEGLVDFYLLTESDRAFHGPGPAALANRLLPPTVLHAPASGDLPGAKVAAMTLPAFAARMRRESRDTTLWARFVQPARLLHARDAAARAGVVAAVAEAWRTAAWWADRLADGPARWEALFAATYAAELRVERPGRAAEVVAAAPEHFAALDALLPPAQPPDRERAGARRRWRAHMRTGRALNALRLVKAAVTFRGGVAYARGKIARHAAPLSPVARRAPWVAAPLLLLSLWRRNGPR